MRYSLDQAYMGLIWLKANDDMLDTIAAAGAEMGAALKCGKRVFSCGNGGSMCDAIHFAEELSGRYREDRPALAAQAISDVGHLTCVANDYGYEHVFSRYLQAHGRKGDFLLAISTSGKSANVLMAIDEARRQGMRVIGLSARGWPDEHRVDFDIRTPAGKAADRVQELHIKVIHILIEIVERVAFT